MIKRILFRIHQFAGLSAGLVLAVVGVTGALLSFEHELLDLFNPERSIAVDGRAALSIDQLIDGAQAANPGSRVRNVTWSGAAEPIEFRLAKPGQERGAASVAVDPFTGSVLPEQQGTAFFRSVEQWHRNLAVGPVGKQIVGASTAIVLVLLISGLVLRWPRGRALSPRAWLKIDTRIKGRAFIWRLHAVVATWCLLFFTIFALTGLWWSYDGYRSFVNQIAGVPTPPRTSGADARGGNRAETNQAPTIELNRAWRAFFVAVPDAQRVSMSVPQRADAPLEFRYLARDAAHDRAYSTLKIDPRGGQINAQERYTEFPLGRRFVAALFPWHSGSFFGWPGRLIWSIASAAMPLLAITGIWLWLTTRKKSRDNRAARAVAQSSIENAVEQEI